MARTNVNLKRTSEQVATRPVSGDYFVDSDGDLMLMSDTDDLCIRLSDGLLMDFYDLDGPVEVLPSVNITY